MLLTAVDDKYLDEAQYLIKSCARHAPQETFYLFLVNSSPERVAPLQRIHPKLEVEHVSWPYDRENWRGIMCCARSIPIAKLLHSRNEPLVYLDSDTILRGPLDGLFEELKEHDLLIRLRPDDTLIGPGGTPHGAKFNSGVIAVRPTPATLEFTQEYDRRIRDWIAAGKPIIEQRPEARVNVYIDQEFLYLSYESLKDRLRFKPLPEKFNDAKFRPDGVIWHGKGTARRHPAYRIAKLSLDSRLRAAAYAVVSSPLSLAYFVVRRIRRLSA
ncbi:MAG: hypothetical protein H6818_07215 [Phycisphaerales bacterium]|nr:hypothetical protein [Phycisphaerales bacterium]MCB9864241.1 hypothetical protein [Phycisphaerales bacterium]